MHNLYKKSKEGKKKEKVFQKTFVGFILLSFFLSFASISRANLIDDIKAKITGTLDKKQALEDQIKQTELKLQQTGAEKQTLQKDLSDLNAAKKKLDSNIQATEGNIAETSKTIGSLESDINAQGEKIDEERGALFEIINDMSKSNADSAIVKMLGGEKLSDYLETNQNFENTLSAKIQELKTLRDELGQKKDLALGKKTELSNLKDNLSGQKSAVVQTQTTKDKLLKATQSSETNYQKLLTQQKILQQQVENELFQYESDLQVAIDPSKLPSVQNGILAWPVDTVRITQLFGVTSASARLYASGSHNGVDFGVPDGTPVKAVLTGTVIGTGNTDLNPKCLSYGKWVAIQHTNGLTSVYGHMSAISVTSGQPVTTGQIIGYSGRTGYATGPHLHLSILASQAVKIGVIPNEKTINCRGVTIPLALGTNAFLDPMIYLPK